MNHIEIKCRRSLCQVLAAMFLVLGGVASGHCQEHNNSTDAFHDLNVLFRLEYAEARGNRRADTGPVILVRGDYLVLLRGTDRQQGTKVHSNYHDLKVVSHGPLALFCILDRETEMPLSVTARKKLNSLKTALSAMADDLETAFEVPVQRARQVKLVHGCLSFIQETLESGINDPQKLDSLIDGLRADLVLNAAEAARMRIDNYHAQMKRWRKELDDEAWAKIHVIIPGAAMPRQNSLAVRYFAKLFEQAGEGNRVIYAESQFDEAQALKLFGTHLLDSRIGSGFFDDSSRMKRDLLGPFANAYLDALDFEALHKPG